MSAKTEINLYVFKNVSNNTKKKSITELVSTFLRLAVTHGVSKTI